MRASPGIFALLLLAGGFSSADAQARTPRASRDSQTVVFVCEHGTVKSVIALAYFQQLAQARQLPFRAISRGTSPDPVVPDVVQDGLRADGLPLSGFAPQLFTASDLASAIMVVSFDQPTVTRTVANRVPVRAWDGLPAVMENYGRARSAIRARVEALIDSLGSAQAPS